MFAIKQNESQYVFADDMRFYRTDTGRPVPLFQFNP